MGMGFLDLVRGRDLPPEAAMIRYLTIGLTIFLVACGDDGTGTDAGPHSDGGVSTIRSCSTTFRYTPPMHAQLVSVAGEWNNFDATVNHLKGPDQNGTWSASIDLPVGSYGYKLVVDGDFRLDPLNVYTKYVGGVENSVVEVDDCHVPILDYVSLSKTIDGTIHAVARYVDGASAAGADPSKVVAMLDGNAVPSSFDPPTGNITVDATGLAKDKHRLIFQAADRAGHVAGDLHVPFWIEDQSFDFRDGILYFAFTDRFQNGDKSNDAPIVTNLDPRADYQGGDFAGIEQAIESGYFDQLGVGTIWISPPFPNPEHAEDGGDGHDYSGYHGYWPDDGKSTEKRFGDLAALKKMVAAAHKRGIRVLVDSVLNHVHIEHPYYLDHKNDGWFNGDGSCVCGGPNCDWDTYRLVCWFDSYLPDLNYESFPALTAMVDDALFWAREADVDGYRVDAVKHFLPLVGKRLRGKLKDLFEHDGNVSYYLVGETFTGGDDAGRALIASYLGPDQLSAQFDFPIYWNILGAFAQYSEKMSDLDNAANASAAAFGNAPMSPFFGNHDVARFITTASGMLWNDPKAQAWSMPPPSPSDDVPYQKLRLAIAYLFTQPGVPLIYYGDEIGMPGAGDPDNRRFMKWSGLSSSEQMTLDFARKVGTTRRALPVLGRGARYTMWADDDLYVYARSDGKNVAVVAINRSGTTRTQAVPVRPEAPISDGTMFSDRLGGPSVTAANSGLPINLPPMSAAIYAP
jgi:glycosidase